MMYEKNEQIKDKLYCQYCRRKTNHKSLMGYIDSSMHLEDPDFHYTDEYYITQCLGCENTAFFREYHDEGMVDYYQDGRVEYSTEKYVYPNEPEIEYETLPKYEKQKMPTCPKTIYTLYSQVIDAFNNEHHLLSSVGLRMIVEAICNELGITSGPKFNDEGEIGKDQNGKEIKLKNLEGRINALKNEGNVSNTQMHVLHEIRHLGNISAHELKVPEYSIVYKGIGVVEHCLIDIFEHPELILVKRN